MATNRGKEFEKKTLEDFQRAFPRSFTARIPDQQSKYKGSSSNICDVLSFAKGRLYLCECKSTNDSTFNFSKLRQYDLLLEHKDEEDVYPGVLLWFVQLDLIFWVPVSEIEKMKLDGKKSIHPKWYETGEYKLYKVPAKKMRTYFKCDLTFLSTLKKED